MPSPPDKYAIADVFKHISKSRKVWFIFFIILLASGYLLVRYGQSTATSIGISLIASSIVASVSLLIDHIHSSETLRAAELAKAGILAVYPRRDLEEYDKLVQQAKEIDVLGYTLRAFTEANVEHIKAKIIKGKSITIRMLLVDPNSSFSKAMQSDEGQPVGSYKKSQTAILNLLSGLEESVQIRMIDSPITSMIYRIDDIAFVGSYPKKTPSKLAHTFKVSSSGWIFEQGMKDFNMMWEEATPLIA